MKLDPGIYIAMHSVLSLKSAVTQNTSEDGGSRHTYLTMIASMLVLVRM